MAPLLKRGLIWEKIKVISMEREACPLGKLNLSGPKSLQTSAFLVAGLRLLVNAFKIPVAATSINRAVMKKNY